MKGLHYVKCEMNALLFRFFFVQIYIQLQVIFNIHILNTYFSPYQIQSHHCLTNILIIYK